MGNEENKLEGIEYNYNRSGKKDERTFYHDFKWDKPNYDLMLLFDIFVDELNSRKHILSPNIVQVHVWWNLPIRVIDGNIPPERPVKNTTIMRVR